MYHHCTTTLIVHVGVMLTLFLNCLHPTTAQQPAHLPYIALVLFDTVSVFPPRCWSPLTAFKLLRQMGNILVKNKGCYFVL